MSRTINDLREHLFATLEGLRNKDDPLDIDRAKAVAEVAQTIINSAKVEVEHMRVAGGPGTGFVAAQDALPAPAQGPRQTPQRQGVAVTRDAARDETLAAQGFVSPQRAGDSQANALARQANCDALAADVKRARAQIDVTRAGLERTVLTAPFAGVVARVNGEVGEFVTPSPPGIATPPAVDLIDDSCLYVTAPMDEVDAPRLKPGMSARITLDALPGQSFPGHVRRIAPYVTEVERQARTVDVEVDFDEPEQRLLLVGYSADAEVIIERRDNVLRLPTQAIRPDGSVLVLGADGVLAARTPKTGLANWTWTEVLGGLAAGDRVVTAFDDEAIVPGARAVPKPARP